MRLMKIAVAVRVRPASGPSTLLAGPLLTSAGGRPDEVRVGTRAFRNWSSVVTGSDQQRAFDQLCTPLLRQLADGYAITFLAYGQTGSGKTHTIFGPPGSLTQESLAQAGGGVPPAWGLLPRLALELLRAGAGSTLHASAIEVYQDKAYDLLADRAPLTVGTKSAGALLKATGRTSIIVFFLASILLGSGVLMVATGVIQLQKVGITSFRPICGRAGAAARVD